ncbi:hypothetical protein FOL47_001530 [Perkinsus chesapeaki]|uniref:DNA helicase n=1 Tax=Perkinsus chesapeaki TaxID=330153 RepID=A0A7J6MIR4_PERCH|nr:hypothetical protein FOL47_001530 [Perkinsus chesapeaki]
MSSLPPLPTVKPYNPTNDDLFEADQLISSAAEVPQFWAQKYEKDAVKNWDLFYKRNKANFFKDRHYLVTEFGEVARSDAFIDSEDAGHLVEIGCGVGNAIVPLAEACPKLTVLATDCSSVAIDLLDERLRSEDPKVAERVSTRVVDATSSSFPPEDMEGTANFVLLLFCMSAISEAHYGRVIEGCKRILKPGGIVLFRDYGKYDLAQLRFSKDKGRAATASRLPGEEDFYVRQDGTRAKFFTEESLADMWESSGGFERVELITHRRCVINRKQGKEMKRVWIQAKWKKPEEEEDITAYVTGVLVGFGRQCFHSAMREEEIRWSPGKRKKLDTAKPTSTLGTEREAQVYLKSSQTCRTATTLSSTPRVADEETVERNERELMGNFRPCATQAMDAFDREEELELLEAAELIEAGESGLSTDWSCCTHAQENLMGIGNDARSPPMSPERAAVKPSGRKLIPGTQVDDDWSDIDFDDLDAACTQVECAVAALKPSPPEGDDDDEFGSLASEDLLAAMDEIEAAANKAAGFYNEPPSGKWSKYVESRISGEKAEVDAVAKEVRLTLEDGRVVVLKGPWYWFWQDNCDKLVHPGDPVNLVFAEAKDFDAPVVYCGDTGNLLVFHPSILLSGTTVSNTLPCQRKTLLQHLLSDVGRGDQSNVYASVGNGVHSLLQNALMFGSRVDEKFTRHIIDSYRLDAWFSGFSDTSVLERHMRERIPQIDQWLADVMPMKFSRMLAAEQNVNSYKFGLKGKIDAVMEMNKPGRPLACLEIKTGKPWHTHVGQVTLYHLLMVDLYGEEAVRDGLLEIGYFSGNRPQRGGGQQSGGGQARAEVNEVQAFPNEIDNLICVRNALALHIARKGLPPTIGAKRECQRSVNDFGCEPPITIDDVPPRLGEYIRKWWRWLRREERAGERAPIIVLEHARVSDISVVEGKQLWTIEGDPSGAQEIAVGDELHVSYQQYGPRNIAMGDVTEISAFGSRTKVFLSMRDDGTPEVTPGTLDVEDFQQTVTAPNKSVYMTATRLFKLSKVDWGGVGQTKRNRSLLLELGHATSGWAFILSGAMKPKLPRLRPCVAVPVPYEIRAAFGTLNDGQKSAVCGALEMARGDIGDRWILPVCGYPGTGKSSMLGVLLLGLMYGTSCRVLLVSHTHTAVDNLLLKTKKLAEEGALKDFDFVRVGRSSSSTVRPELANHYPPDEWPSVDSISDFMCTRGGRLVACTALSCHNPLLWPPKPPNEEDISTQPPGRPSSQPKVLDRGLPQPKDFDIVVVDEAGQAADSTLWCALKLACRGAVLVGDQYQLPPVIKDRKCRDEGMSETFFARCARDVTPIELTAQYRMQRGIQRFVNELFYEGKLRCGSREVENAKMPKIFTSALAQPWMEEVWNPDQALVMVDVGRGRDESRKGDDDNEEEEDGRIYNREEAQVIRSLITTVPTHSLANEDVVILSPYVKQVKLIEGLLATGERSNVEVMTVDRSQGRDWKVVIISLVRSRKSVSSHDGSSSSSKTADVLGLLDDWRRLNVAITRAKLKVIIVCSPEYLTEVATEQDGQGAAVLRRLIELEAVSPLEAPADLWMNARHFIDGTFHFIIFTVVIGGMVLMTLACSKALDDDEPVKHDKCQ